MSLSAEKLIVNYRSIKEKANMLKRDFGLSDEEFKASNTWVYRFCRRHKIGSRSITHHGQVDNLIYCYIGMLYPILISRTRSMQPAAYNYIIMYI